MTRVPVLICNRIPIGPSGPWDGAIEALAEPSPVVQREVFHDEVDISTGDGRQFFETGLTVVPGIIPCGIILIDSGLIPCGIGGNKKIILLCPYD